MKVWIIARSVPKTYGQGDFGTALEVAMRGPYGSDGPHPAFATEEAARRYLAGLEWGDALEPLEMEMKP